MCLIPFLCKKFLNSMLIKVGPLSDTTFFGIPNCAKNIIQALNIADAEMEDMGCTSIHLECESIKMKNI